MDGFPISTCKITRAGLKETSTSLVPCFSDGVHPRMLCTSFSSTWKLSQLRTADSSRTRMQKGSESAQGDNNNKDNKNIDKDDYLPYLLSMEGRSKYL